MTTWPTSRRLQYFKDEPDAPAPLVATARRVIRFQEVDLLKIAWHGHFVSYFEDARVALGEKNGIGYLDLFHAGLIAPLVQVHVDYIQPLTFRQEIEIEARLHWCAATRLNHSYCIRNAEGGVAAAGYTVQLIQNVERQTLLVAPPFLERFRQRWQAGEL